MMVGAGTWVVVVVSEDTGEARAYGSWRTRAPAAEFARVLACEQRCNMDKAGEAAAVAQRARDAWNKGYDAAVAEIVKELRGIASYFGNGEIDHPAVMEAADLIESRFAAKEGEGNE